jgi:hypothetical protein
MGNGILAVYPVRRYHTMATLLSVSEFLAVISRQHGKAHFSEGQVDSLGDIPQSQPGY